MKFRTDVPDIKFMKDGKLQFEVKSVQEFEELEDRVIIRFAEHVDFLKRGYVCDIECEYLIVDQNESRIDTYKETVKDLVLVYINQKYEVASIGYVEYTFYK